MRLIIEILLTIGVALSASFFLSGWWLVAVWVLAVVVSGLLILACMANPRGCGQ